MQEMTYLVVNASSFQEDGTYYNSQTGLQNVIEFTLNCFQNSAILVGLFANCLVLLVLIHSQEQLRHPPRIFWTVINFFKWSLLLQFLMALILKVLREHLENEVVIAIHFVISLFVLSMVTMVAIDCYFDVLDNEWYRNIALKFVVFIVVPDQYFLLLHLLFLIVIVQRLPIHFHLHGRCFLGFREKQDLPIGLLLTSVLVIFITFRASG